MTTLADADFVGSAVEVAVTVASAGLGTLAGAVNKPDDVIDPHDPATQPIPDTVQVTPVFEVPDTVALNCCCALIATVTEAGDTATETLGAPMETVALPVWVTSKRDVAATVTVAGLGAVAGAV